MHHGINSFIPSRFVTFLTNSRSVFLQDEKEFRDKLSPIFVALNFSLNPQAAADVRGLRPILNYQTAQLIEQKVRTSGVTNIPQCLAELSNGTVPFPALIFTLLFLMREDSLYSTFSKHTSGKLSKLSGKPFEKEM